MAHGETTAHGENNKSSPHDFKSHNASFPNGFSSQSGDSHASRKHHIIDHEDHPEDSAESSQKLGKLRKRLSRRKVQLITTASHSPAANRRKRERHYMWIQGMRIPFLLLSGLTYVFWENMWLSAILFVISVPLPWIAVVIANGVGEPRDPRAPAVYKPGLSRSVQQSPTELHTATAPLALPQPDHHPTTPPDD